MNPEQLRVGMRVLISKNIDSTTKSLSSNPTMKAMAGDRNIYKIDTINSNGIAVINSFVWMSEDLINAEEGYIHPLPLKGKKVTFDLCEL